MNILKSSLVILFIAIVSQSFGQKLFSFNPKAELHAIPKAYEKESAIYLRSDRMVDFAVVNQGGTNQVRKMNKVHWLVKVLDNKGVEAFNTMHLPISEYRTYTNIKARCITSKGKLIEITKDKIRKQKDDAGREEYFIAFEGVDAGSEIEFLLESEAFVNQLEGQSTFTSNFPILSGTFQLEVPDHLVFEVKGYNGFVDLKTDTLIEKERIQHTISLKNSKPLPKESYGNSFFLEPRVGYRLAYNPGNTGDVRINSWDDLAQALQRVYFQSDKKDQKRIKKFLNDHKIKRSLPVKDRIVRIEEVIKTNFVMSEELASTQTIAELIKNKTGNSRMITKLYAACFDLMGVGYSLGLSCNRYEHQLDESFEIWSELDIFLFKFDDLDGYLMPQNVSLRYPLVPLALYGNKAVFCRRNAQHEDASKTKADIDVIKSLPAIKNSSIMKIDVSFDKKNMDPIVTTQTEYYGLSAAQYRPIFSFIPEKKHKEILMEIAGIKEKEENVRSYGIKDYELTNIPKEVPCVISTTVVSPQWLSKAGPTYLFKVGETIGRQAEMYEEEDPRVLPIDIQFTHHLIRNITIDLMPGYKVKNLDDIIIDKQFGDYGFVSSYKIKENKLLISIDEYYKRLEFPKEQIESFRSVINAAADFNKVTLVLEKE